MIPFVGLKTGSHTFQFTVSNAFFEEFEYSIIHSGTVHVDLVLEKKETMMIGVFSCEGEVATHCDRCNDPLDVFIKGSFRLIFKQGTDLSDDESLIVLPPEAFELDVSPYIYELITVFLPVRKVHEEGGCNEEMVKALSQYLLNPEDEGDEEYDDEDWNDDDEDDESDGASDSRWTGLNNLN